MRFSRAKIIDDDDLPLAMIHPVGDRQLLITTSSQQPKTMIITALRQAGVDLQKVSDSGVITIAYGPGQREKKVISLLASILRNVGFRPALPGRGRQTYRPL